MKDNWGMEALDEYYKGVRGETSAHWANEQGQFRAQQDRQLNETIRRLNKRSPRSGGSDAGGNVATQFFLLALGAGLAVFAVSAAAWDIVIAVVAGFIATIIGLPAALRLASLFISLAFMALMSHRIGRLIVLAAVLFIAFTGYQMLNS